MNKIILSIIFVLISGCSTVNFSDNTPDSTQERIQDVSKVDHG